MMPHVNLHARLNRRHPRKDAARFNELHPPKPKENQRQNPSLANNRRRNNQAPNCDHIEPTVASLTNRTNKVWFPNYNAATKQQSMPIDQNAFSAAHPLALCPVLIEGVVERFLNASILKVDADEDLDVLFCLLALCFIIFARFIVIPCRSEVQFQQTFARGRTTPKRLGPPLRVSAQHA
jgi:hypothetical protein